MIHTGEDHSNATAENQLLFNFHSERKSSLSITTSDGQVVSLLNDEQLSYHPAPSCSVSSPSPSIENEGSDSTPVSSPRKSSFAGVENSSINSRRKYKCSYPGCFRSFTTSGHLARHNRIHTGEKNFPCLMPGCPSRFSRQDNMMQHYRTHLSSKSRRGHRRSSVCSDISKDSHSLGVQGDVNYFFFEHAPRGIPRSFPSTPTDDRFHLPKLPSIQERRMSVDTAALPQYSQNNFPERYLPPTDISFCFNSTNNILNRSRQHLDRTKPIGDMSAVHDALRNYP
ncbi:transcriptional repressor [Basidiobolus ranarum]|uniref:Transcriptional repressor n=1 Tax=Basidiobolus ranarum TaxID=34480 RepID=A0ABR2WZ36_9FUNG